MGCNCIQEIKDRVEREENAIRATVGSFDHQCSEVAYTPIRLDGQPSKHSRYKHINWNYCPWCGEKIQR